jgi:hypothetical protein
MTKKQIAILSFLFPVAGIAVFFFTLEKDKKGAFQALAWAAVGMVFILVIKALFF